jgi:hypothetical protein
MTLFSWNCVVSNNGMIVNNEMVRTWKKAVVA